MTSIARSTLPLSGVRVVDFGQYIAGPAVAMILGDLGATVVHIDPPSGPLWDNPANAILNRNKLIVALDLKTEKGLLEAKALVAKADIVIENFRPGVLARLGIDFSTLRESRPELITLSIPGFATPAEKYGASTRAVLRDLNYTDNEIDRLIASGTISETWSAEYLPS